MVNKINSTQRLPPFSRASRESSLCCCPPILKGAICFVIGQGVNFSSKYIFLYRQRIFYIGVSLGALAILAGLIAKTVTALFLAGGAALFLGVASWAFRAREAKISHDLGVANGQLVQSLQEARKQLENEKANVETLEREKQRLNALTASQEERIQELEASNKELSGQGKELEECDRSLDKENEELLRLAYRFEANFSKSSAHSFFNSNSLVL